MKGSFSEEALRAYSELAAEKQGLDFAEGDSYDFTRCVRPDGSVYGTGGRCRKGTETAPKTKEQSSARSGKDGAAALRAEVEAGAKKRGEQDRQKNILDARARVKEIQDEIRNRGPHSKEEKAYLAKQLKQAQNNLERFETGKMMTREQFQAGLKRM